MLLASLLSIVIPAGCRRPVSGRASDALERARSFVLAHEDTSRLYLDSVRVLDDGSEWRVLFLHVQIVDAERLAAFALHSDQ